MKFIPQKYLLEEGKVAPEGTVECTCKACKNKFAVPAEELGEAKLDNLHCEECAVKIEKAGAEVAASLMSGGSAEAMDALNKALGK